MNDNIRNILALLVGLGIGLYINAYLINKAPVPDGFNPSQIAENIKLFKTKHFAMHIIAHGVGAFVGAIIASAIAATQKNRYALAVGFLMLLTGIFTIISLQYPFLPAAIDIVLAYIPMAWLGGKFGVFISKKLDLDLNQDYYNN